MTIAPANRASSYDFAPNPPRKQPSVYLACGKKDPGSVDDLVFSDQDYETLEFTSWKMYRTGLSQEDLERSSGAVWPTLSNYLYGTTDFAVVLREINGGQVWKIFTGCDPALVKNGVIRVKRSDTQSTLLASCKKYRLVVWVLTSKAAKSHAKPGNFGINYLEPSPASQSKEAVPVRPVSAPAAEVPKPPDPRGMEEVIIDERRGQYFPPAIIKTVPPPANKVDMGSF